MADGIPPAVDKVGSSAPGASESVSQAPPPAGLSGAAPAFQPTSAPTGPVIPGLTATAPPTASAEAQKPSFEEKKLEKDAGGAGPALSAPKPVEVHSVPDTPMGSTPAGGTPKPELPIPTEKIELPKSNGDASAAEKAPEVQEPPPTPAVPLPKDNSIPEPIKDAPASAAPNGKSAAEPAEMTGAIQTSDENSTAKPSTLKRKLEDDKPSEPVNGGPVSKPEPERVEKKAKLDETAASAPSTETSTADKNGGSATSAPAQEDKETGKSNGRAKRGFGKRAKKIAEAVVGKTARKTRSQGPA